MSDAVILYPSSGRGHVVPMVELGKLISKHHPSISITIIILTLPNETTSTNSYIATVSAAAPSINFIHIVASSFEIAQLNNRNLHQAILTLSSSSNVKALVIDYFCNFAVQVSSCLNIPTYYFCAASASALCHLLYCPTIHKNIAESLKDLDILVDAPGTPSIPSKDLPLVMLDRSHRVYQYFINTANQMAKSSGIIVNTFESLGPRAVKAILEGKCTPDESFLPPIYCIGPIVSTSESKEEHECLIWLDSQPSRSVVFLCFGSMGVFSATQLKEMAIGLEKVGLGSCGWCAIHQQIIKPEAFYMQKNEAWKRKTGFVVKLWAPQVAILNHGSVGLFVTHCGWNSILESVCAGVPMLAWPLYAEQKMNRTFLVEGMKMGLKVSESEDGIVSAAELEQRLTEMMKSEKGKEIERRVMAIRACAVEAVNNGGSSRVALAHFVESL
ncbi:hypothetical protein P3X46_023841 [Hevea brasiliensis]|uniref:Glycosyltransferase n=1 Tax=Hevea brasiliensis TaxID=3981 RepID=A0ABQ9LDB6_HEVBR|nr:hypothetical protein P3X46_023841 [Hevea brasiliensis]